LKDTFQFSFKIFYALKENGFHTYFLQKALGRRRHEALGRRHGWAVAVFSCASCLVACCRRHLALGMRHEWAVAVFSCALCLVPHAFPMAHAFPKPHAFLLPFYRFLPVILFADIFFIILIIIFSISIVNSLIFWLSSPVMYSCQAAISSCVCISYNEPIDIRKNRI
jgi:hypothetical protein